MNWNEIKDKSGKCKIIADLSILKDSYTPTSAQDIIDKKGVEAFYKDASKKIPEKSVGRKLGYIRGNPDMLIDVHYSINLIGD
ncbi:hypothetical protein LCH21_02960 [Patescibacteria group bacterium]|nr:hypothetical protein [Patescibacteria group bacterium]